jgi:hypothetical protein
MDIERLAWRTSSFSSGNDDNGSCVEVAPLPTGIAVRDTKDRSRAPHVYSRSTWESVLNAVRSGVLDG